MNDLDRELGNTAAAGANCFFNSIQNHSISIKLVVSIRFVMDSIDIAIAQLLSGYQIIQKREYLFMTRKRQRGYHWTQCCLVWL